MDKTVYLSVSFKLMLDARGEISTERMVKEMKRWYECQFAEGHPIMQPCTDDELYLPHVTNVEKCNVSANGCLITVSVILRADIKFDPSFWSEIPNDDIAFVEGTKSPREYYKSHINSWKPLSISIGEDAWIRPRLVEFIINRVPPPAHAAAAVSHA